MLEILKTIIFGIVEGITEWLPISSTGTLPRTAIPTFSSRVSAAPKRDGSASPWHGEGRGFESP